MTVSQITQLRAFGAFVGPSAAGTSVALGRVSETDSARPLGVIQTIPITPAKADEFDFAGTLYGKERKVFLQATEADAARVIRVLNKVVNGQVVEHDYPGSLQPYSIPVNVGIDFIGNHFPKTVELDTARAIQILKLINRTYETDLAGTLALVTQNIILASTQEIDFSLPVRIYKRPRNPISRAPTALPVPQTSTVTSAERRMLSDQNRPREVRAIQRDRHEFERLTWPPMSTLEVELLLDWWEDELVFGGAWFAATWPLPRGMVGAVRKFYKQPESRFVPGGYWKVSALCEVRGASVSAEDL